jgi:hypothetical protein
MDFDGKVQAVTHRLRGLIAVMLLDNCLLSIACSAKEATMPRYGKAAGKSVRSAMRRKKHGTLRSGRAGRGGPVKSRKQAIAIGLSEARKKGAKVPAKKS